MPEVLVITIFGEAVNLVAVGCVVELCFEGVC